MNRIGKHLDVTAESLERAIRGGQGATPRQVVSGWALLLGKADIRLRDVRLVDSEADNGDSREAA